MWSDVPPHQVFSIKFPNPLEIFYFFAFGLNITEKIYPNSIAAVIPPAALENPPVKIPINPDLSISSMTPVASVYPKPVSGTLAPAPANLISGSYTPNSVRIAPRDTKHTSILAGVSFV